MAGTLMRDTIWLISIKNQNKPFIRKDKVLREVREELIWGVLKSRWPRKTVYYIFALLSGRLIKK